VAPAKILVILRRSRPGKGWRTARGSPATGLWPKLGSGRLRRRSAAAAGVGSHWSSGSGELSAGVREWAARYALVGVGKGVETLWPTGGRPDGGASHGRDGDLAACARTAGRGFYSRASGAASSLRDEGTPLYSAVRRWPRQARSAGGTRDGPLGSTGWRVRRDTRS
jgi:hypothetical protein